MTKISKAAALQMREDVLVDMRLIRSKLDLSDPAVDRAWAGVETFANVALRVMAKTNLSKLRSEGMTVEIAARMAGHHVFDVE